jgi:DNA-binding SARP family transcriptional activator
VANLRSAIWKLRGVRDLVVEPRADRLGLAAGVVVDVTVLVGRARRVIECARGTVDAAVPAPADLVDALSLDVLPDWDEDWVIFERERIRQLRIHAMEALSSQLRTQRRYGEAIDAGLAAVAADPLRESAQRVLIEAHLAEGNTVDARRQFETYRELLWDGIEVLPSPWLTELVERGSAGG